MKDTVADLLTIDGSVNGKLTHFILDIGSAKSIMSTKAPRQRGIRVHHTHDMIKVATQAVAEVDKTEEVEVDIRGHKCRLSFLVLESLEYDALLGMDYCDKIGIVIRPRERHINLRNDTIYLPRIDRYVNDYNEGYDDLLLIKDMPDEDDEIDAEQFIAWNPSANTTKEIAVKPEISLPRDVAAKFNKLVPLIRENSARSYKELNGGCRCEEFEIKLKSNVTIFKYPYKRSELESEILRKESNKLFEAGIIRLSDSPYSSPFFTVNKKDKTPRPVIDYRELNKITEKIDWPISVTVNLFFKMRNAKIFSLVDAKSGFFQIPIKEECKKFTAFSDGTRNLF